MNDVHSSTAAVFADDGAALANALVGVDRDAVTVHTASPALVLRPAAPRIVQHDAHYTVERLRELATATQACSVDLYGATLAETGNHHLGVFAARQALVTQNVVFKAGSLLPERLASPVIVAEVDSGDARTDQIVNTPWPELLPATSRFERVVCVESGEEPVTRGDPVAPLWTRVRFEGIGSIGYRLGQRLFAKTPNWRARGRVWVAHESSLLKETAFWLMTRGLSVGSVPTLAASERRPVAQAWLDHCRDGYRRYLTRVLPEAVVPGVLERCMHDLEAALGTALARLEQWQTWFERYPRLRPDIVLSGFPNGDSMLMLLHVCEGFDVVTASFQHGVQRELARAPETIECLYENTAVQHYFTYNAVCAQRSDASRFAHARSAAVGLSADLRAGVRRGRPAAGAPILYVSTALYTANVQLPGRASITDTQKAMEETTLVNDVLARLPHRVRYKPYTAVRYRDPDPVLDAVRASASVELFEQRIDLRYVVGGARVVVCARATSTVAWCIMSGRPLVYIDRADQPLSDAARAAFADAFFLFDAGRLDFLPSLRAFLSQPIAAIDRAWADRHAARDAAIRRFVGESRRGAGGRAGRVLLDALRAAGCAA